MAKVGWQQGLAIVFRHRGRTLAGGREGSGKRRASNRTTTLRQRTPNTRWPAHNHAQHWPLAFGACPRALPTAPHASLNTIACPRRRPRCAAAAGKRLAKKAQRGAALVAPSMLADRLTWTAAKRGWTFRSRCMSEHGTSMTCFRCRAHNKPNNRLYKCNNCLYVGHRDVMAAANICVLTIVRHRLWKHKQLGAALEVAAKSAGLDPATMYHVNQQQHQQSAPSTSFPSSNHRDEAATPGDQPPAEVARTGATQSPRSPLSQSGQPAGGRSRPPSPLGGCQGRTE